MKSLSQEFRSRFAELKKRSEAAGTNITQICKSSGVSRTTPERWGKRIPKSILLFDKVFAELERIEKEQLAMQDLSPREQRRLAAIAAELVNGKRERRNAQRRGYRAQKKAEAQK